MMKEFFAGVATFFAMSYIAFLNPVILQEINMPSAAVFLATCGIAALASFVAGWKLNIPAALACGMGLNVFTQEFARSEHAPWQDLILICGMCSLLVLIMSLSSWRRKLIDGVPDQIFYAIKAGVGAILTTVSVTQIDIFANDSSGLASAPGKRWAYGLFILGLAIIIGSKLVYLYLKERDDIGETVLKTASLLDSAAFSISIVIVAAFVWLGIWHGHAPAVPEGHAPVYWAWALPGSLSVMRISDLEAYIGYGIAVFFIMTLDIAGSPIEYVRQNHVRAAIGENRASMIIDAGMWIDSGFNILASVLGVTPITYYAENHAGWKAGGRTGTTTYVVAGGFALLALFGLASIHEGLPILEVIPRIAALPTLFFVGLLVIAESFTFPVSTRRLREDPGFRDLPVAEQQEVESRARALGLLPAAATSVLTSITLRLDVGIAAGILVYVIVQLFPRGARADSPAKRAPLELLVFCAAVVLVTNLVNALSETHKADCTTLPTTTVQTMNPGGGPHRGP
ncbi:MAG: NCS2 family permease [Rhodospirillales bacterium]|jgi:AGZA family xanthine/uracil permease-like MFS transporter|nr:NCS2 family permease [Rhodospirillales bacterium]